MNEGVIFQPIKWEEQETETELYFHVTGLNQKNETVHARIEGFCPFAFLQLPSRIVWSETNQKRLIRWITSKMGDEAPVSWKYEKKFLIRGKVRAQCLRIAYPTSKQLRSLGWKIYSKYGLQIDGIGRFTMNEFRLHEHTIDTIVKYTAMKKLKLNDWLEVKPRNIEGDEPISTCTHDVRVYYKNVKSIENITQQIDPLVFSFDIETYSQNKNAKSPDPSHPNNVVFQIAVQCGRMSWSVDRYQSIILSLNSLPDIEGTEVRNCKTERELIEGFSELILELDPDVFTGYNILKFDWEYLLKRAEKSGCYHMLLKCGRFPDKRSTVGNVRWSSSAYGQQNFEYLNVDGRVNIDLMPEVERNHKLDTYSLNAVSKKFLHEEEKDDMDYRQMFTLYEISRGLDEIIGAHSRVDKSIHKRIIKMVKSCVTVDDLEKIDHRRNHVRELCVAVKKSTPKNIVDVIRCVWKRVGVYCVQDTILPVRLFGVLHVWEGLKQLANVTCIPMWYLQTRGQQIKVLSQLYRRTLFENIVIENTKNDTNDDGERYQGATVIDPIVGFYEEGIVTNDFASLYPSIIQAYNISPDTFVTDSKIPDDKCHVIEWDDHRGCDHDDKYRKTKVKKEDILCGHHRYRFIKEKRDNDGNIIGGEGIIPKLLRCILAERKSVKKRMKTLKKSVDFASPEKQTEHVVLDSIQKGLKISANSAYGFLGAKKGMCPLPEGAASVTAVGRWLINETARLTTEKYPSAQIIYGDTDSVMVNFRGASLKERFRLGVESAAYVTSHFPKPIELEFECVYQPYLLMGKKAYATRQVDEDGNVLKSDEKGLLSARRESCHVLRELYVKIMDLVRAGKQRDEVVYTLISNLNSLFHHNHNYKKFVLYKGIQDVDEYDDNSHDAHVMLARKMARRGNKVAPNTRMQYVILENDGPLQGDKVEDWEYYVQNRRKLTLRLDYTYYLDKFINPFTALFDIRYPREDVLYEKAEDGLVRQLNLVDEKAIATTNFCFERFSHIRRTRDKIAYIKQELDRQSFPVLFDACDRWMAANVIEKIYAKYGVPKRVAKKPKKGEVTLRKDCKMMKEFHLNHVTYHRVVDHLNTLFATEIIFE